MLIGPTIGRETWYTPRSEAKRLEADPHYLATGYLVRVPTDLDQVEIANASANVGRDVELNLTPASAALAACRRCVIGWRNQGELGEDGKPRKFAFVGVKDHSGKVVGATQEDTSRIPPKIRMELLEFIRSLWEVAEADFA